MRVKAEPLEKGDEVSIEGRVYAVGHVEGTFAWVMNGITLLRLRKHVVHGWVVSRSGVITRVYKRAGRRKA